jgi:ABC-type nickel/cobalt efflux system permease component RcnA
VLTVPAQSSRLDSSLSPGARVLSQTLSKSMSQKHPIGPDLHMDMDQATKAVIAALLHCASSVIRYDPAGHSLLFRSPHTRLPARVARTARAHQQANKHTRTHACARTHRTSCTRMNATQTRTQSRVNIEMLLPWI